MESFPITAEFSLTQSEVAALLKVNVRTLRHWRQHKVGPPSLKLGKRVWYSKQAVEDWLKARIQ